MCTVVRTAPRSAVEAGEHLGLSRSQVHRLLNQYRMDGATGLVSGKRGKLSNRRYSDAVREHARHIVQSRYHDFGPTLAAEKLQEVHQLSISKETMRKWMAEAGLWEPRIKRKRRVYQPRNRRDCFGELIQIGGSHHWWFEERGPKCALLVYIDNATSILVHLRFAESENAFDYERANKTLQDRLVKELRLEGIDDIQAANAFVPKFIADFNNRFAKEPRNAKDMHRPFTEHDSLDGAMCHKEQRTLSNTLTLRYDKVLFILETSDLAISLARKRVTVCDYPDVRLEIQSDQGVTLPYTTFD